MLTPRQDFTIAASRVRFRLPWVGSRSSSSSSASISTSTVTPTGADHGLHDPPAHSTTGKRGFSDPPAVEGGFLHAFGHHKSSMLDLLHMIRARSVRGFGGDARIHRYCDRGKAIEIFLGTLADDAESQNPQLRGFPPSDTPSRRPVRSCRNRTPTITWTSRSTPTTNPRRRRASPSDSSGSSPTPVRSASERGSTTSRAHGRRRRLVTATSSSRTA